MTKKYYAGIGWRETPERYLKVMTQLARRYEQQGYILRSGGANGADSAFEAGVANPDNKEVFLPYRGFNKSNSSYWNIPEKAFDIASRHHPSWYGLNPGVQKLMARNVQQIMGKNLDSLSEFVICYTKDGCESQATRTRDTGGTGLAISLASSLNIPIINLKNLESFKKVFYCHTNYYGNMKNSQENISISRTTPKGIEIPSITYLAPDASTLSSYKANSDVEKYQESFNRQLNALSLEDVMLDCCGKTLLCYEADGDFCHRHLVSHFMKRNGLMCEEIQSFKSPFIVSSGGKASGLICREFYTEDMCRNNPDKLFIFGDNLIGKGKKGQAIIRDFPNSFGIPTKRLPSMDDNAFFGDRPDEEEALKDALKRLWMLHRKGYTIVFPQNGIGTGLAKMDLKSPILSDRLSKWLMANFGFQNKDPILQSTPEAVQKTLLF